MANIIPMQVRQKTRREMLARFSIVGSLVAIATAFIACLSLLPSYIALSTAGISPGSAAIAAPSAQQVKDDAATVKHVSALLHVVSPIFTASSSVMSTINSAVALRPKQIRIDQMLYSPGKQGTLMLSGSADAESAISDYRTALLTDPRFTSVSVPVGALVGTDAGRFSVTITGKF